MYIYGINRWLLYIIYYIKSKDIKIFQEVSGHIFHRLRGELDVIIIS